MLTPAGPSHEAHSCLRCSCPSQPLQPHEDLWRTRKPIECEKLSDTDWLKQDQPTSCIDMSDKKVTILPDTETTRPDSSVFFPDITLTWSPGLNRFLTLRAGTWTFCPSRSNAPTGFTVTTSKLMDSTI